MFPPTLSVKASVLVSSHQYVADYNDAIALKYLSLSTLKYIFLLQCLLWPKSRFLNAPQTMTVRTRIPASTSSALTRACTTRAPGTPSASCVTTSKCARAQRATPATPRSSAPCVSTMTSPIGTTSSSRRLCVTLCSLWMLVFLIWCLVLARKMRVEEMVTKCFENSLQLIGQQGACTALPGN